MVDVSPDVLAAVSDKLSAARTHLILDKPFLGALVLRLPMVAAEPSWCPTTATDARQFFYNAAYVDELNTSELQFMLAHEALHCGLSHFARRDHRSRHLWDIACDYAINPLLLREGLAAPPGTLYLKQYEDMTAEEIYPMLGDMDNDLETLDKHIYDQGEAGSESQSASGGKSENKTSAGGQGGDGDKERKFDPDAGGAKNVDGGEALAPPPAPLSEPERSELAIQWQQRLAGAAQQAMQAGKLGDAMARLVDHLLQPQLPWRSLLARYVNQLARDDYSYQRPSSRREGPVIYPSLRNAQMDLVVAVDVSGSISTEQMAQFVSELDSIKAQIRARILLLACDCELDPDGPWVFEAWEECRLPDRFKGGRSTDFRPVFHWVEQLDTPPAMLIIFTDAQGQFPEIEPDYPVLWLVKGRGQIPWGQRVQLN